MFTTHFRQSWTSLTILSFLLRTQLLCYSLGTLFRPGTKISTFLFAWRFEISCYSTSTRCIQWSITLLWFRTLARQMATTLSYQNSYTLSMQNTPIRPQTTNNSQSKRALIWAALRLYSPLIRIWLGLSLLMEFALANPAQSTYRLHRSTLSKATCP